MDLELSPDGAKITCISENQDNFDIWVMNPDGSGKERLLSIPYQYSVISGIEWSSDGSEIVFGFHPNYGDDDIYVIDVPETGGGLRSDKVS